MKRVTQKIIWGFLVLLSIGSLSWGVRESRLARQTNDKLVQTKHDYRGLQVKLAKSKGDAIQAREDQAAAQKAVKTTQNNSADNKEMQAQYRTMDRNLTTIFNGLYNYDQDSYSGRANKLKGLLSESLNDKYFGKKSQQYGDSSQVTSKLTQLHTYREAVSGSQIRSLVLVNYKSRYAQTKEWNKGTSVYEVTYDDANHTVKSIKSVLSKNK